MGPHLPIAEIIRSIPQAGKNFVRGQARATRRKVSDINNMM
jgi:hypothetical protein